jgi:hypothetical protein
MAAAGGLWESVAAGLSTNGFEFMAVNASHPELADDAPVSGNSG